MIEDLMTTEQFAAIAHAPVSTIRYWRAQGIGPAGFRVGKRVLYARGDVEAWLDEQRRRDERRRADRGQVIGEPA